MKREHFFSLLGILGMMAVMAFLLRWYREEFHLRSFYYWKSDLTTFDARAGEMAKDLHVNHLYLRMMDLGWNEYHSQITPVSTLDLGKLRRQAALQQRAQLPFDGTITPVVFLDNRALERADKAGIEQLATNLLAKVEQMQQTLLALGTDPKTRQAPAFEFTNRLQLDCDWSPTTRDRYFLLLRELKQRAPLTEISCTIRMAPLRHSAEFGIPPVSRGMLMCYNVGSIKDPEEPNSILNVPKATGYLRSARNYPLTLDAALPLFAWGVQFRNHEFQTVLNPFSAEHLADTALFTPLTDAQFQVRKDTVLGEYLLREGDRVRWESIKPAQIEEMLTALGTVLNRRPESVTFYHWDEALVGNMGVPAVRGWLERW